VWANLPLILKDLGSGATGAIMSANPQYSITDVKVSDAEITYYSQSLTSCGAVGSNSATNPANYYAGGMTDAPLTNASEQEVTAQQADSDSLYSVMSNAEQYHNTLGQVVQCKIIRNITIGQQVTCPYGNAALNADSTVCTEYGEGCSSYCSAVSGCQLTKNPLNLQSRWWWGLLYGLWGSGQNITGAGFIDNGVFLTIAGVNMSGGVNSIYPDFIMDVRGSGENLQIIRCTNINMADPVRGYGWGVIYASNAADIVCTVAGEINIPGATITMNEDPLIKGGQGLYYVEGVFGFRVNGNELTVLHNGYDPYGYYYGDTYWNSYWWGMYQGNDIYFWNEYCTYPASRIDIINESINDQCTQPEQDSKCRIQDEKVDGVYTYKNYQPTGLVPLATCKDFTGFYSHRICRDWWEKDRTYLCQSDSKFDFTDSMKRVNEVYETTKDVNTAATYTDYRRERKNKYLEDGRQHIRSGGGPIPALRHVQQGLQDTEAQAGHPGYPVGYNLAVQKRYLPPTTFITVHVIPTQPYVRPVPVKKSSRIVNVSMSSRKRSHCWRPSGKPVRMQYVHQGRRNEKIFYHHSNLVCVGCSGIRKHVCQGSQRRRRNRFEN